MSARTWLYRRMVAFKPLTDLVGGEDNPRIFAKKSMNSHEEDHPFIVYKLGFAANEDIAEDMPDGQIVERQFVQIWVHDYSDGDSGDYARIDQVLLQIRAALHKGSSAADGVFFCRYLETSQDLNDETLNTVTKYARFQITKEER